MYLAFCGFTRPFTIREIFSNKLTIFSLDAICVYLFDVIVLCVNQQNILVNVFYLRARAFKFCDKVPLYALSSTKQFINCFLYIVGDSLSMNDRHIKHAKVEEVEGGSEQKNAPELDVLECDKSLLASVTVHLGVKSLKVVAYLTVMHSLSSHEDEYSLQE